MEFFWKVINYYNDFVLCEKNIIFQQKKLWENQKFFEKPYESCLILKKKSLSILMKNIGSFPFVPPPPVRYAPPPPPLQCTFHYRVIHYVKKLHVRLGVANNMHPLSGGGGHKRKRSKILVKLILMKIVFVT